MFNPRPQIRRLPIDATHDCLVIDDALAEPEQWVEFAQAQREAFAPATHNAFPGPELALPPPAVGLLGDYFAQHVRGLLGGRRTLAVNARLSMVALPTAELLPRQWFCHRDHQSLLPGQGIAASVLYLFRDEALGGTAFYAPRRPPLDVAHLIHDAGTMDAAAFRARHPGIAPGYMAAGNDWFEQTLVVPPRFNRLIFYDGGLFHTSHVTAPERLSTDLRQARLTMNGFFTCRMAAG